MSFCRILVGALLLGMSACASSSVSRSKSPSQPVAQPSTREHEGDELLGTTLPEWQVTHWNNSPPLTLASLRGKAVLLRFWAADCPYCSATAPSLRQFDRLYRDRGLVVVGFYHHKSDTPLDFGAVEAKAKEFGFNFPVAVDENWKTLLRYWQVEEKKRDFTSVSFLLDRNGAVRHIHPGGEYVKGQPAYDAMVGAIESVLAEPPKASL